MPRVVAAELVDLDPDDVREVGVTWPRPEVRPPFEHRLRQEVELFGAPRRHGSECCRSGACHVVRPVATWPGIVDDPYGVRSRESARSFHSVVGPRRPRSGGTPMAEAYIIDTVRTPVGRRGGGLSQVHPADLGRTRAERSRRAHRDRSLEGRGRRLRLPRHHRPPGGRHRPHLLAGRRASRRGAGHHRRPSVRFVAAGGALRSAGRHVGDAGPRRRRRRAEHVGHPDLLGDARRRAVRLHRSVLGLRGLGEALRRPAGRPVPRRRDDRRELGPVPRGDGGVRRAVARACDRRPGRGSLRLRDRAVR